MTIKGGVVMRSLSGEIRRATQDIDLDFIRYSISEERVFTNSTYKKQVERSRKNWLDMSVEEVLKKDLEFVQGI